MIVTLLILGGFGWFGYSLIALVEEWLERRDVRRDVWRAHQPRRREARR